ncbi:MAG: hypothetical protein IKG18_17315 [Atopobiaceae bacterium]|nr:hypothetical protein [Atopobiaceae bacterium]
MRTGAAGGIGAKLLARPDSRTLLIVGAGGQCACQAAGVICCMPGIERVIVTNPHRLEAAFEKAKTIAGEVAALGVDFSHVAFEATDNVEAACGEADVIVTCTMSRKPMIERSWVRPGTHLSCIGADMEGKVEVDPAIVADALWCPWAGVACPPASPRTPSTSTPPSAWWACRPRRARRCGPARDGVFYDEYPIGETRCDATVGGVEALAYMQLRDVMDELIVITEDEAASACAFMAREEKLVAEVASCMTVAAVRCHREQVGGTRAALVISGGNTDGAMLDEVLRNY